MAGSLRDQGTTAFRAGHWDEAVKLYTAALKLDATSDEAGACYSNRAAAHINLYRYDLGRSTLSLSIDSLLTFSEPVSQRCSTPPPHVSFGRPGLELSLAEPKPTPIYDETIFPLRLQAIKLAEDDELRARYEAAAQVVLERAETLANATAAMISEIESNQFWSRYQELAEQGDPRLDTLKSAESAMFAYNIIHKAMEELDEQMLMLEDGTVEAMSPSPVLSIADGILTDPRGFHIPPGRDDKCPLAQKLTIQLECDLRVLNLTEYCKPGVTAEKIIDDFDAMVKREGGWNLARLSLAALIRGSFVSAFISEAQGDTAAAVSKYLFTHAVVQAGRERWADVSDEARGSSFRFTFARNVKVHLMLALEEAHFKAISAEERAAASLADIQSLGEQIMEDCVTTRLPEEPVLFLAFQIQPIVHAGKAIGFCLGQRARAADCAAKLGPALYLHPVLAAAAAKMYTSAANLLPADDPDRPLSLYHSIAYDLRAGGMTVETLFARVAEAEAAMTPPELVFGPTTRVFDSRTFTRTVCDDVRGWIEHLASSTPDRLQSIDDAMRIQLQPVPTVTAEQVKEGRSWLAEVDAVDPEFRGTLPGELALCELVTTTKVAP